MAIDVKTTGSPGWWLQKLAIKLAARQPRLEKLDAYHRGDPPLPENLEPLRPAYQVFQKKARTNFAELVVGAVRERCAVRSIRTAQGGTTDGDSKAWEIWRDNNLSIEFSDVLENMLALGDAYMIVGEDPDNPGKVIITGEDPRQVVTIHNPVRQSEVRAAAKFFHDPDEQMDYAYLYLQGGYVVGEDGVRVAENARVYRAFRSRKSPLGAFKFAASSFTWDTARGGEDGLELPHLAVPVVRFRNRRGVGEFEPHIDVLDRINDTLLKRMVIVTYQAFKMRAIKVDENDMPDEDPETGEPIDYSDVLTADPGSFIKVPANAEFWESDVADMTGVLGSIKDDVQHLAAVTRTPLSVVSPDAANTSAAGSELIKEGQIFKTEDKQNRAAAALVDVISLAFQILGDSTRSERNKIVIDWMPAERFSLQQKYDAASKAPKDVLSGDTIMAEILQFTPEQIAINNEQKIGDALLLELNTPPAAAPRQLAITGTTTQTGTNGQAAAAAPATAGA